MPTNSTLETPIAHLMGPGRLRAVNGRLTYHPLNQRPIRLDLRPLRHILMYGRISLSDEAVRLLLNRRIAVGCLSSDGMRCRGSLAPARIGPLPLRLAQYRLLDDPAERLVAARWLVELKIESQWAATRHYQRQGTLGDAGDVLAATDRAKQAAREAGSADALRGAEAWAARAWFGCLPSLVAPHFEFPGRRRRPPTDPVNAMLSLGYTLLTQRIVARCQGRGLDVELGALHESRSGRPALACDLIEPLRTPCVDRWVIGLCRRQSVRPDQFRHLPDKGVRASAELLPDLLASYEQHQDRTKTDARLDRLIDRYITHLRHPGAAEHEASAMES